VREDFFEHKIVLLALSGGLLAPFAKGQFPDVARALGVAAVFIKHAPQFEKDLVTVRIGTPALPEELFGFGHFVQALAQPVRGNGVGFDLVRIEFGRNLQPREDFPGLFRFFQMRVARRKEMAAETVDPIAWRPHECRIFRVLAVLFVPGCRVFVGRHVRSSADGLVEDRRVIATVKIDVGFYKKVVGKKLPAIAHHHVQQIARLSAAAGPALVPGFQLCRQSETEDQEQR